MSVHEDVTNYFGGRLVAIDLFTLYERTFPIDNHLNKWKHIFVYLRSFLGTSAKRFRKGLHKEVW